MVIRSLQKKAFQSLSHNSFFKWRSYSNNFRPFSSEGVYVQSASFLSEESLKRLRRFYKILSYATVIRPPDNLSQPRVCSRDFSTYKRGSDIHLGLSELPWLRPQKARSSHTTRWNTQWSFIARGEFTGEVYVRHLHMNLHHSQGHFDSVDRICPKNCT